MCNENTYPFLKLNCSTIVVWKGLRNSIPLFIMVVIIQQLWNEQMNIMLSELFSLNIRWQHIWTKAFDYLTSKLLSNIKRFAPNCYLHSTFSLAFNVFPTYQIYWSNRFMKCNGMVRVLSSNRISKTYMLWLLLYKLKNTSDNNTYFNGNEIQISWSWLGYKKAPHAYFGTHPK